MPTVGKLAVIVTAETAKFDKAMKKSAKIAQDFGKTVNQGAAKAVITLKRAFTDLFVLDVGRFLSSATQEVTKFIDGAIKLAAAADKTKTTLRVLIGDLGKTEVLLKDIRTFAAATPLGTEELADTARALLAFKGSADTVMSTMKRLGDISAATGTPLKALAEIYGKARVQGTLFAEDINQLTGRGIDVISEFASQLGVSTDQVKKLASQGQIGFANLKQAFIDMTKEGGKFNDILKEQGKTLDGVLNQAQQRAEQLQRRFGEGIAPIILEAIDAADKLLKGKTLTRVVAERGAQSVRDDTRELRSQFGRFRAGRAGPGFRQQIDRRDREQQQAGQAFRDNLTTGAKALGKGAQMFLDVITKERQRRVVERGALTNLLARERIQFQIEKALLTAGGFLAGGSNLVAGAIPAGAEAARGPAGFSDNRVVRSGSAEAIRLMAQQANGLNQAAVEERAQQTREATRGILANMLAAMLRGNADKDQKELKPDTGVQ